MYISSNNEFTVKILSLIYNYQMSIEIYIIINMILAGNLVKKKELILLKEEKNSDAHIKLQRNKNHRCYQHKPSLKVESYSQMCRKNINMCGLLLFNCG